MRESPRESYLARVGPHESYLARAHRASPSRLRFDTPVADTRPSEAGSASASSRRPRPLPRRATAPRFQDQVPSIDDPASAGASAGHDPLSRTNRGSESHAPFIHQSGGAVTGLPPIPRGRARLASLALFAGLAPGAALVGLYDREPPEQRSVLPRHRLTGSRTQCKKKITVNATFFLSTAMRKARTTSPQRSSQAIHSFVHSPISGTKRL